MAPGELSQAIAGGGWTGRHCFVLQIVLEVLGQQIRGFVAPTAFLLERFHDNPVEFAGQQIAKPPDFQVGDAAR